MLERDMSILTLEVKTRTAVNQLNLGEDLRIDPMNLSTDFCEQPAKFAYWATVAAQARALVDRARLKVDQMEENIKKSLMGELDAEVRQTMELDGVKITEAKVQSNIYTHPKYIAAMEELQVARAELVELQEQSTMMDVAKDAMNQRKDMLISLGAQIRAEGANAEVFMREHAEKLMAENKQKRMAGKQ